MRFMIVVALIDFFKIFITQGYFFLSMLFFAIAISASNIGVLRVVKRVIVGEAKIDFSLTSSHSLKQIFLKVVYSLSF